MPKCSKGRGALTRWACSVRVFIVCERAYALRRAAVMPQDLVDAVIEVDRCGRKHTVLARIVEFAGSTRTTKWR